MQASEVQFAMSPVFLIMTVVVVVLVLWALKASARQRAARPFGAGACANCGTSHPNFAQFCRRCGQRLP